MKIGIYYFSGTGNTLVVSELLQGSLREKGHSVSLYNIELIDTVSGTAGSAYYEQFDMIGLGCPILGGGTPGIVIEFVKKLPELTSKPVFLFKTAADHVTFNHAASSGVIKRLKKKGYNVFYDRIIVMGSNWLLEYDHRIVKQLYDAAVDKSRHMAEELTDKKNRRYRTSLFLKAFCSFSAVVEEKLGAKLFGKTLFTDKSCTNCGLCVRNCPTQNITDDKKIKFNGKCMMCMRCVYSCPLGAIRSRGMNFCILPGGFNLKKIINESSNSNGKMTKKDESLLMHFHEYLTDRSM